MIETGRGCRFRRSATHLTGGAIVGKLRMPSAGMPRLDDQRVVDEERPPGPCANAPDDNVYATFRPAPIFIFAAIGDGMTIHAQFAGGDGFTGLLPGRQFPRAQIHDYAGGFLPIRLKKPRRGPFSSSRHGCPGRQRPGCFSGISGFVPAGPFCAPPAGLGQAAGSASGP